MVSRPLKRLDLRGLGAEEPVLRHHVPRPVGERAADHEDTVAALEEVERLLRSTSRRLSRLLRELDRRR